MAHKMNHTDPRKVLNAPHGESHPDCFNDSKQYRDYLWLMKQSNSPQDNGYCIDCVQSHKEDMMSQGRCAHPETRFVIWRSRSGETEVIGVSNVSRFWSRAVKGDAIMNWNE